MSIPYTCQLRRDQDGRIIEKTETVKGNPVKWSYTYDDEGRLHEAHLDGRMICQVHYDKEGRRREDFFPRREGHKFLSYSYGVENRLRSAGNNGYVHDENGFRKQWNCRSVYTIYDYSPDYRLLKAEVAGQDRVFTFEHNEGGQRMAKILNGRPVEAYQWLDFIRLAGFHDGEHAWEFAYEDDARTPYAMRRDDGFIAALFYDQVGSLRVVADQRGNVIKGILYDPFGGIIEDTNPALRIPIGFAGGLHDRDLGLVRFGWRDYDPFTGRWTAPDPIGDKGGDPDWYGYCLDDPVNGFDPLGLWTDGNLDNASKAGATGGHNDHSDSSNYRKKQDKMNDPESEVGKPPAEASRPSYGRPKQPAQKDEKPVPDTSFWERQEDERRARALASLQSDKEQTLGNPAGDRTVLGTTARTVSLSKGLAAEEEEAPDKDTKEIGNDASSWKMPTENWSGGYYMNQYGQKERPFHY